MARCSEKVQEQAYCAVVRPHLEYASCAWDPYLKKDINQLEGVKRRATRFIKNDYSREPGTVTAMYKDLNWYTLEKRRQIQRFVLFHKVLHVYIYITIPSYLHVKSRETKSASRSRLTSVSSTCDVYKYSYLPRTIREWNTLPMSLVFVGDSMLFKAKLAEQL